MFRTPSEENEVLQMLITLKEVCLSFISLFKLEKFNIVVASRQSTGETAEPTVIPSSQEDEQRKEESELHLHFTPSQPAETQSVGVSEIVSRLDEPSQGM